MWANPSSRQKRSRYGARPRWIVVGTPQMGSIVQGSSCWLYSPVYTPVGLLLPLNLPSPVEEAFAATLGRLAVARILFDVGNRASIENAFAIVCGIKAPIEVEIGAFQVHTHFFGHLFQRFQAIREEAHVSLIDGCHGHRS